MTSTKLTPAQARVAKAIVEDDFRTLFATKQTPRVLRTLRDRKLVEWANPGNRTGYVLTKAGVAALEAPPDRPPTKDKFIQELRSQLGLAVALIRERDRRDGSTPTSEQFVQEARALLAQPTPKR